MAFTYSGSWTGRGDEDVFTFSLVAGQSYAISLSGAYGYAYRLDAGAVNPGPEAPDPGPTTLAGHTYNVFDSDPEYGKEPGHFTASATGTYSFRAVGVASGAYTVTVDAVEDDFSDNIVRTGTLANGVGNGVFERSSDADLFAADLVGGDTYFFSDTGRGATISTILVLDANGVVVAADQNHFDAPQTGRYYFAPVASSNPSFFTGGAYSFTVSDVFNGYLVGQDFNRDLQSDVLWRNADGALTVWTGQSVWENGVSGTTFWQTDIADRVSIDWKVAGVGDFNGDEAADILWRNDDGRLTTWRYNTDRDGFDAGSDVYQPGTDWSVAGIGDADADRRNDLVMRHANGDVAIWYAAPDGSFAAGASEAVTADWNIAGVGYFNDDNRADILWRNDNGTATVWYGRDGGFDKATFALAVDASWSVAGIGDFNGFGDGAREDILWRNADGRLTSWFSTPQGFTPATYSLAVDTSWHVEATGEYSGDGRADILWRNDNGRLAEWDSAGASFVQSPLVGGIVPLDWQIVL